MTIEEMLSMPTLQAAKPPARYLLRAVNPVTGEALDSRYLTMKAALAKAAKLLPDEYCIEIWSSASLESRARPRLASKRRHDRAGSAQRADAAGSHGGY